VIPLSPIETARPTKIQPIGFDGSREATSAPTIPAVKKMAIASPSLLTKCVATTSE
jgi:hypothetical protein